jgi:hypothetical protein
MTENKNGNETSKVASSGPATAFFATEPRFGTKLGPVLLRRAVVAVVVVEARRTPLLSRRSLSLPLEVAAEFLPFPTRGDDSRSILDRKSVGRCKPVCSARLGDSQLVLSTGWPVLEQHAPIIYEDGKERRNSEKQAQGAKPANRRKEFIS